MVFRYPFAYVPFTSDSVGLRVQGFGNCLSIEFNVSRQNDALEPLLLLLQSKSPDDIIGLLVAHVRAENVRITKQTKTNKKED